MPSKKWSEREIKQHIIARHGNEPLNYNYYVNTYPAVHAAATRYFGSWRDAIEACGIDYNEVKRYRKWSRKEVLVKIRQRWQENVTLASNEVQKEDKPLYMAALKRFGNWGAAVEEAGVNYDNVRIRRNLSPKEVHQEILARYYNAEDLAYPNARRNFQYLLAAAARKLGDGSWDKARKRCGIKDNFRRQKVNGSHRKAAKAKEKVYTVDA